MAAVRGSLFRKYLIILFTAVVVPLLTAALSEAWFGYSDQRAQLSEKLRLQTGSSAYRIEAFANEIRDQLGWVVQLPWTDREDEQRTLDATDFCGKPQPSDQLPWSMAPAKSGPLCRDVAPIVPAVARIFRRHYRSPA